MSVSRMKASTILGVFTFAGVITLEPMYMVAEVALVYAAVWPTFRRAGAKLHRHAYTGFSVVLACLGAAITYNRLGASIAAVPPSILVFIAINAAMIAAALAIAGHHHNWPMLRSVHLYATLCGTMSVGAGVGYAIHWHMVAGLAGLPVIFVVHTRTARETVRDVAAFVDGIWNRVGWLTLAEERERSGNCFSALLVDVRAHADMPAVLQVVREWFATDSIGRYSDLQLVVLLDQAESAANALAVRLTAALRDLGVMAGAGAAENQQMGLADVLAVAECAAIIRRSTLDEQAELR